MLFVWQAFCRAYVKIKKAASFFETAFYILKNLIVVSEDLFRQ